MIPVPGKLGNKCDPNGKFRCFSLVFALDGQDPSEETGLLCTLVPPYVVGVRFLDEIQLEPVHSKPKTPAIYRILLFKHCPFCGVKIPHKAGPAATPSVPTD